MQTARAELAPIFVGEFVGTVCRAAAVEALSHDAGRWRWAIFIVTIVGTYAPGYSTTRLQERLGLRVSRQRS